MSFTLVERIKERLNIVDIIGQYVKLTRAGVNHKGCCPFHHEKTPSFFVSESRQTFTCFGCGVKGDVIEFVKQYERLDFREALKVLFDKSGLPESDWEDSKQKDAKSIQEDLAKKGALIVMDCAVKVYAKELQSVDGKIALEYLQKRGLKDSTIKDWEIGFAPELWQFIESRVGVLCENKTLSADMISAGLLKTKEHGETTRIHGHTYDFFRGRITFPIFDINGKAIAISARIIGTGEPKYLNSPDTIIFNKSHTLYGLHKAKEGMRKWKFALLVEGQMDLLMCHQEGFDQAVATSGTALTDEHLRMLKRYTNNLMLVYDADQAGMKATIKAWSLALKHGLEVKVAVLPKNEDPASVLLDNKGLFIHALKQAVHVIEYVLSKSDISSRSGKKDTLEKLIPLVASLDSNVDKEYFAKRIADVFEMSLDGMYGEIRRYEASFKMGGEQARTINGIEHLVSESGLVLDSGNLVPTRKALAELKALLYIYTQQLNSLGTESQDVTRPDIYTTITQKIQELENHTLGILQRELFNGLTEDVEHLKLELENKKMIVDEKLVYNIENMHDAKNADVHFYEKEIEMAYKNFVQKIYTIVFDTIKTKLKKAEQEKNKKDIDAYSDHIYKLSIYKI